MRYLRDLWRSSLVRLVREHYASLPRWGSRTDLTKRSGWPTWVAFHGLPLGATLLVCRAGTVGASELPNSLLAGVGVLAGLLVQVLASVSGRIGTLADSASLAHVVPERRQRLLNRLSIARANIAYASLFSVLLAVFLGVQSAMKDPPHWMVFVDLFALLHLAPTLVLVLLRINRIGMADELLTHSPDPSNPASDDGESAL